MGQIRLRFYPKKVLRFSFIFGVSCHLLFLRSSRLLEECPCVSFLYWFCCLRRFRAWLLHPNTHVPFLLTRVLEQKLDGGVALV